MPTDVSVRVTVRYFAAARAASGADSETLELPVGVTVAELVELLKERDTELAKVLARCSYLRDGVAVRALSTEIGDSQTIDVLPPFAGG